MKVLFIHEAPGQFKTIHNYINETGVGQSWMLCAGSSYEKNKGAMKNLIPFPLPKEDSKSYFYTMRLEERIKRSFHFRKVILEHRDKYGLDVVVCHGSGGFPLQLFDEVGIPVVTYIEFPSFSHHGFDKKYPQPDFARFADKLFEMSSYHQVIKSDMVLVPSVYAKNMFPKYLHHKIQVQMEGFSVQKYNGKLMDKEPGVTYIGFTARDLSSAKGFEQFIEISKRILKKTSMVKFVFCGSPKVLYSYETAMLESVYGKGSKKTFMQHILEREGIDLDVDSKYQHIDFLAYDDYVQFIESMDIFLYPLQYGSANWGIFEILLRGKPVVVSNRCFLPEIIRHGYNGVMCDYDAVDDWVEQVLELMRRPERREVLGQNAMRHALEFYSVERVAERYMKILRAAVEMHGLGEC